MENQNQNNQINEINTIKKPKGKFWKFVFGFAGIIILAIGGFFAWSKYLSPQAKYQRETQKNYEKYLAWEKNYEKALIEDVYGGKTPEETLQMFIEALKKEDIELASKYFALNTSLSRDEWKKKIIENKEKIINIVLNAKPTSNQELSKDTFWFSVYDDNGEVEQLIEMSLNLQSNIWKIESL